jgi:putative colanic acid biosynthesis glycosyltransferase
MRFSIVTICYNDLSGLRRTRESVLAQSCRDFEWIVVDGGSSDGTADWLREVVGAAARWTSERDGGLYDAMNKGLDRAEGDFVVFMNSGDCFGDEDSLAAVSRAIDACGNADLVYGDSIDVHPDGRRAYRAARSHATLWRGMFTSHQSMYFSRRRIGEMRHRLALRYSADYDFVARFLSGARRPVTVAHVPAALCHFLIGGQSGVHRMRALAEDDRIRGEVLRLSRPVRATLVRLHAVHHWLKQNFPKLTHFARYRWVRPA